MQDARLRELATALDIEIDYLISGLATRARQRLMTLRDSSKWEDFAGDLTVISRRSSDGRQAKHSTIALTDAELQEATAPIRDPLGVIPPTLILNAYFDVAFEMEIRNVEAET